MKQLFTILLLFIVLVTKAQDSVKVRITKVYMKDNMTHVKMKTKHAKYKTVCFCKVAYRRNDIVMIKKPN